jgi:3-oxoacyl-[acyl-carrier protein] reductase
MTPHYPDLDGKVAVVTGGSAGIGAATCRALAENGVRVVVAARGAERVDALVDELRATGADAVAVTADATRMEDVLRLRDVALDVFGPVDLLVPFAGGFLGPTPLIETAEDEWRQVIDSNLTATFLALRAFVPDMVERRRGAVVTMASSTGRLLDVPITASYAAAKAGIVQLTRHAALELGPHNVRVNCVAPATVLSERVDAVLSPELRAKVTSLSPLGRVGLPEDPANAALFLLSDAAGWLTGVTLDVAGGRVML